MAKRLNVPFVIATNGHQWTLHGCEFICDGPERVVRDGVGKHVTPAGRDSVG